MDEADKSPSFSDEIGKLPLQRTPTQFSTQDELVRRYFAGAAGYAQLYEGSSSCAQFFNERLRRVLEFIAPIGSGRVLEVGCGPGILLSRLGSSELDLYGLDCCPEMIAEAKKRTAGTNVRLTVGRAQQLPFEDQSFDLVLALGVLEYLPQLSQGLAEIARVATPNATIVVSMVNVLSLYQLWERFVYFPLRDNPWLPRPTKREVEPSTWWHRSKPLMRIMRACHLEPVELKYFDLNICVPPFDSEYPQRTGTLNRWVDGHSGPWLSPLLHRAFIVKARRNASRIRREGRAAMGPSPIVAYTPSRI